VRFSCPYWSKSEHIIKNKKGSYPIGSKEKLKGASMSIGQSFVAESVKRPRSVCVALASKSKFVSSINHISIFFVLNLILLYAAKLFSSVMFYSLTWPCWRPKRGKKYESSSATTRYLIPILVSDKDRTLRADKQK
jgi:hypothetical protein